MELQSYTLLVPESIERLQSGGAFLTARADIWNPMTIGWAQFGIVWGKPIVTVLVRKSRFTYPLMEQGGAFTVSVPKAGEMVKELAYCGSHSGRDVDKAKEAGLSPLPARADGAMGVCGCAAYFECRVVHKLFCPTNGMEESIVSRYYGANQKGADGDPHMLYFGEVTAAYRG